MQDLARASAQRDAAAELLAQDNFFQRLEVVEACRRTALLLADHYVDIGVGRPMKVNVREAVSEQIYLHRTFEPELMSFFSRDCRPGDIFFDVGSHFGYFAMIASALVGDTGHVIAFEPVPDTFTRLSENTLHLANVRRELAAAWSEDGHLQIQYFGLELSAFSSFSAPRLPVESTAVGETLHARSVTLDSFCAASGLIPTHIKIDAENAEADILRGLRQVMAEHHPTITVEVGDEGVRNLPGQSSRDLLGILLDNGYDLFDPGIEGDVPHVLRAVGDYNYGNVIAKYAGKRQSPILSRASVRGADASHATYTTADDQEREPNVRFPSKVSSLSQIKALGLKFDYIVDVGVQSNTPELVSQFPDSRHFLFEPVEEYWRSIGEIYRDIDHVDFKAAASDATRSSKLHLVERSGTITHAHVNDDAERTIEMVRLDDALQPFPEVFGLTTLLKIDVDGHEMSVLEGASALLPAVGAVIIEAPLSTIPTRLNAVVSAGFQLWDIVDLGYWHNQLSQVDLVFLNNRLLEQVATVPPYQSADLLGWTELTTWFAANRDSTNSTED